jgi:DnaJ family protein A protein 2
MASSSSEPDASDLYGKPGTCSSARLTPAAVLEVLRDATKSDIKKAYHRAALASHPDKVTPDSRDEAEARFKAVSRAYEILSDDDARAAYDAHGMSAFEQGPGAAGSGFDADVEEMLSGMFGYGMGGSGAAPGRARARRRDGAPLRGEDEQVEYAATLEELYVGKTAKMAVTKSVACEHCKGTGGKERAKPVDCATCRGSGEVTGILPLGGGLVTRQVSECGVCGGTGEVFKDKDKCRRCHGERVVQRRKVLELYVPRGAGKGERIVLHGEADQKPGTTAGDLVFVVVQEPHKVFSRMGRDLCAEIEVQLFEALTGLDRVVLRHLDGRGISVKIGVDDGKVLRPGQVFRVPGEGMPLKKTEAKGDLYLVIKVIFPADGWLTDPAAVAKLKEILPGPGAPVEAEDVDEVEVEESSLDDFGGGEDDDDWEDEHEHEEMPQCQPQ